MDTVVNINWWLVGAVAAGAILGIIVGILLGKRSMSKKDI